MTAKVWAGMGAISALLLLSACFACPPVVMFDESHDQVWSIWDTGVLGYSELAVTLMERGCQVCTNSTSLSDALKTMPPTESTLVLGVAKYQNYTPEEIAAVLEYVAAGGGLLLIGEHDNIYGCGRFQNRLSERLGVCFNADFVEDPDACVAGEPLWIRGKCLPFGLEDVGFYFSASLTLSPAVQPLVQSSIGADPPGAILAARARYHKGRVAWLGDSEFLWNGGPDVSIGYGDNLEFISRVFQWLLDAPLTRQAPDKELTILFPDTGKPKLLFLEESFSRTAENFPGGLSRFANYLHQQGYSVYRGRLTEGTGDFDVVVLASPLRSLSKKTLEELGKMRKIVAVGDSFSSIRGPAGEYQELRAEGLVPRQYPLSELTAPRGLEFLPCILVDRKRNCGSPLVPVVQMEADAGDFYLYRGAVLKLEAAGVRVLARGLDSSWAETTHPGCGGYEGTYLEKDRGDRNQRTVMAATRNLLVLTDADVLSNQHFDSGPAQLVASRIARWLNE